MSNKPDLKGSSFALSVLHLTDDIVATSVQFLHSKIEQAPAFFQHAPVVVNIEKCPQQDIDYVELYQGIKQAGMIPVGITGCTNKQQQNLASEAGFAIMSASKDPNKAPAVMAPSKIIRTPVRSGQQVYAKDADLVVLSHVSAGAEIIADGSIHIHGTCRGRVLAGANGQKDASIICQDLQAELVSIAGKYWLSDQIDPHYWNKKVLLTLKQDNLKFEELSI